MIEVEKKFILNERDQEQLTKDAEFINRRIFTDIYYDTESFSLTTRDKWLRSREGKFELKLPLHNGTNRLADQYYELKNEQKIGELLGLSSAANLTNNLVKAGYVPFCTLKTTRKKYKKEAFTIDLDMVEFESFTYNIGEIELMVGDKSEIANAIEKIITFAKKQKLTIVPVRGKVIEYLKRIKPKHYQALVEAGVAKD